MRPFTFFSTRQNALQRPSHGLNKPGAWGRGRISWLQQHRWPLSSHPQHSTSSPSCGPTGWSYAILIDLPWCFSSTCTFISIGVLLQCPDMRLCMSVLSASCPVFQAELSVLQSHAMATVRPCMFAKRWQRRLFRPLSSWV